MTPCYHRALTTSRSIVLVATEARNLMPICKQVNVAIDGIAASLKGSPLVAV